MTQPVAIATELVPVVMHLKVDDGFVYYLDQSQALYRVDKDGGTPERLVFVPDVGSADFAVDDTRIYVMMPGEPFSATAGSIEVYDKNDASHLFTMTTTSMLQPGDCHFPFLNGFALSPSGDVYFNMVYYVQSIFDPLCSQETQDAIGYFPPGATTATFVTRTRGHVMTNQVRADASHGYWLDQAGIWSTTPSTLRVDRVYETSPPTAIVRFAIDRTNAYFTWFVPGPQIASVPLAGGNPTVLANVNFVDLVTDGTYLFGPVARSDGHTYNLTRMKPNGHGFFTITRSAGGSVAVDDTFVYYLDTTETKIMKACKLAGL